ncbi:hypothetical protein LP414_24010 [Polaromonas sp. P1(28)-13]|nr:hypothetical protein LP414_24010 [Polaromonas sp. P1(28)-13]
MRKHLSETTGQQRLGYGLLAGLMTAVLPVPTAWQFLRIVGLVCGCCRLFAAVLVALCAL